MNNDFGTVSQDITEVSQSPLIWIQGVDRTFNLSIAGTATLSNPTMALYENGNDVSSTKLTNSLSVSGRTIVSKTLTSLTGGNIYKWYIYFDDDGVSTVREGTIICPKLGVNPRRAYPSAVDPFRVDESPLTIYPSQSKQFDLVISGFGEIEDTSPAPTMYLYKGTTDDSSNSLFGSITVTGRTITLKSIGSLSGGFEYLGYIFFTDNGKATARYFEVICPKLGV